MEGEGQGKAEGRRSDGQEMRRKESARVGGRVYKEGVEGGRWWKTRRVKERKDFRLRAV